MTCKRVKYLISGLLLLCSFALIVPVQAQSKSDLEKQKTKIEAEIKKLNNELSKQKKNTKMTTKQVNALNQKIKERAKLINNINAQLSHLDAQISRTQDSIAHIQLQVDSMKQEYAKVIRVLYSERDNLDKWALLLDQDSYNRSFLRVKYFSAYSDYRRHQEQAIRQHQQQLEDVSATLQKQKNEQNNLLSQEKKNKAALTKEQQQQKKNLSASQAKEMQISAQLSKKEKEKKQLQQQIQRLINEEVAKARKASAGASSASTKTTSSSAANPSAPSSAEVAMSNDFASNKGRFSWPVYYKSVIREYGRYMHESGGENMNNGIDLLCAANAPVYAIFNGTVTRVFICPNGTKGVIIRHGEYMSVYANLGSVSVKEKQNVTTKQTIGSVYTGTDGRAEFSFQIWKGTQSQNPRIWLK